jgi:lipopolysaccharide/colanic/teichoic acid biosynthesis glycosyltransferase
VTRRAKLPAAEAGIARPLEQRAIDASELRPASASDGGGASLADRYTRLAGRQYEDRRLDLVLRGLDLAIATLALLVLLPVIALACLAIVLTSGTPVLYRGRRVGRGGRVYTMLKFRTLAPDAETRLGPYLGSELLRLTDSEVTTVGRWLRGSHLDELPQLWNVLRGEMSIVGPRPIRPAFFEELCVEIPNYWQRLVIRPGLTGFAQLRMTRTMSWAEKLAHDLEYIADRSVSLYLRVVARTAARIATLPFRALPRRTRDG